MAGLTSSAVRPLLVADDLTTTFATKRGDIRAVDGVSIHVALGETLGIVGESGSGKSVLARTAMGLSQRAQRAAVTGRIEFDGRDVEELDKADLKHFWGKEIAMIFQDPMTSLNPVKKIGTHLMEPVRYHLGLTRQQSKDRAIDLLAQVGIPGPARCFSQYPHELSGGMRQRVCIALALACRPRLLIADEPTTALDVTVQRQILDLLSDVTADTEMSTILITHDLGVVAKRAHRVAVMYAGRIVEQAQVQDVFHRTRHPYTRALLASVPRLGDPAHGRLATMPGSPPNFADLPAGCRFAARCPNAQADCREIDPVLTDLDQDGHLVACHHPIPLPIRRPATAKAVS